MINILQRCALLTVQNKIQEIDVSMIFVNA